MSGEGDRARYSLAAAILDHFPAKSLTRAVATILPGPSCIFGRFGTKGNSDDFFSSTQGNSDAFFSSTQSSEARLRVRVVLTIVRDRGGLPPSLSTAFSDVTPPCQFSMSSREREPTGPLVRSRAETFPHQGRK
ncbi:hypothetical protein J6590_035278 [Homalodisca vitripennis]|nr:hypothetical protein J6590_035278 [Homalodisca vitripennis]